MAELGWILRSDEVPETDTVSALTELIDEFVAYGTEINVNGTTDAVAGPRMIAFFGPDSTLPPGGTTPVPSSDG